MTGPAGVADVVLWLRAKDLGAGGTTATAWPDASGSGRAAAVSGAPAVVAGATPAGGKAVSFTTTSDQFTLPTMAFPVDASSFNSSSLTPGNAIDGNTATVWASLNVGVNGPQWLRLHLATGYAATSYTITPRSDALGDGPKDFTFEGSNDGGDTWDVLDTRTGITWPTAAAQTFTFANATAYRWYRLHVTAAGIYVQVAELSIPGATLASAAGEVWLVVKGNATNATNNNSWSLGSSTAANYYGYNTSQTIYDATGVGTRQQFNATMPVNGAWRLIRVTSDGAWTFYLDGTQQATAALPPAWRTEGQLRLRNGQIAEMLVRGKVSSSAEVANLVGYFNAEHGLTVPGGTVNTVTGSLSAALPAPALALSGEVTAPTVTGALGAALPAPALALTGLAASPGSVGGALSATLPAPALALTGAVTDPAPTVDLQPWDADESGKTTLRLTASGSVEFLPPLALPPAHATVHTLMRESVIVPDLTTVADAYVDEFGTPRVPDHVYDSFERVTEELGSLRVMVGNTDVTWFRGHRTRFLSDRSEEPFGEVDARLEVPGISSLDKEPTDPGDELRWSINRGSVRHILVRPNGTKAHLWAGHVSRRGTTEGGRRTAFGLQARGSLWQASTDVHKAPNLLDPTDIGTLISRALRGVASRRYEWRPTPRTGILSTQRGAWSESPLSYTQGLLATAWTAGGRQWTVAKVPNSWRSFELRLKKDTPQWTITNGARGVDVDLYRDGSSVRNVIYGHGVGPDGYAWFNYHYPNLRDDAAPVWPGTLITIGSTDASTNGGLSLWQARARDLGYTVSADDSYGAADADVTRTIQRRYGLQVDGVVGPQTWNAMFDVGANGGDLAGAIRLPLAADPRTQPYLYNADGSRLSEGEEPDNPAYDRDQLVFADDVDFGAGITRAEGIKAAQQIVDREKDPALVGRITLRTDPREGSRLEMMPGDLLTLIGYEGADRVLHIVAVDRDWTADPYTVTLELDELGRDAMTVAAIRTRNKEARRDPARRPTNPNRRSRLEVDQVVPFDGESGAGRVPKLGLYGGLWTVIRLPLFEVDRVVRIELATTDPAQFAVAVFGAPITPAHLVRYVGNPLASDSPFTANAATLEDRFWFMEGWGQKGQACGYSPGAQDSTPPSPLTGRFVDVGGFEVASARPPWAWLALYSPTTTYISGRMRPAPKQ